MRGLRRRNRCLHGCRGRGWRRGGRRLRGARARSNHGWRHDLSHSRSPTPADGDGATKVRVSSGARWSSMPTSRSMRRCASSSSRCALSDEGSRRRAWRPAVNAASRSPRASAAFPLFNRQPHRFGQRGGGGRIHALEAEFALDLAALDRRRIELPDLAQIVFGLSERAARRSRRDRPPPTRRCAGGPSRPQCRLDLERHRMVFVQSQRLEARLLSIRQLPV